MDLVNETRGYDDLATLITPLNAIMETMYKMEQAIKEATYDSTPIFTFSKAVADIKQLKVYTNEKKSGGLLGTRVSEEANTRPVKKSRIEQLKPRTRCLTCRIMGHWS